MSKQTALEELDSKLKNPSLAVTIEVNTKDILEYLEENWDQIKLITGHRSIFMQRYYAVLRHIERHFGSEYCKHRIQTYLISKCLITPRVAFVILLVLYWIIVIFIEQVCNINVRFAAGEPLLNSYQKYLYFYPMFMIFIIPVWFIVTLEKEY